MSASGRKIVSLLLILCLVVLSTNLYAKKKRGAELIVQKRDGLEVQGELIAVKEDSLLIKEAKSEADVTVDVSDIRNIRVSKKSKAGNICLETKKGRNLEADCNFLPSKENLHCHITTGKQILVRLQIQPYHCSEIPVKTSWVSTEDGI